MQERALRSREAILRAARAEFSAKGFHGARVDRIAVRSGVNKQRLYANFGNKAGLFAAVLRASFAELVAAESSLLRLGPGDIPELAGRILACYVEIHERHPEFWRLLAWENLEGGAHAAALAGLQEPVFRHLRALYAEGQVGGVFRPDVGFEAFLLNLLAVSFFMSSNRSTLKASIGLDLADAGVRRSLCAAIVRQLEPRAMAPR